MTTAIDDVIVRILVEASQRGRQLRLEHERDDNGPAQAEINNGSHSGVEGHSGVERVLLDNAHDAG